MTNDAASPNVRPAAGWAHAGAIAALLAIACGTVAVIPHLARDLAPGDQPPDLALWAVGLTLSLCGGGLVLLSLRWAVRPGAAVAGYAVAYNVLIVLATFTLGPGALYQYDASHPIDQLLAALIPVSAFGILLAYLVVFLVLAAFARARLRRRLDPASPPSVTGRALALGAAALLAGALFASGALPLLGLAFAYPYLVFSAPMGVAVAATLGGALLFATAAATSAADRAALVRDASVLSAVLWSGALLLVLYHVLWLVYVMLLVSLWPLKTVTSK